MLANPSYISSDASLNACQHDTLAFPEKLPITTAQLSTWKTAKASALLSKNSYRGCNERRIGGQIQERAL